jgi:hypothetical protein
MGPVSRKVRWQKSFDLFIELTMLGIVKVAEPGWGWQ